MVLSGQLLRCPDLFVADGPVGIVCDTPAVDPSFVAKRLELELGLLVAMPLAYAAGDVV